MKKDSEQMVFLSGRKLKKIEKESKRDKTGIFETRNPFQISALFFKPSLSTPTRATRLKISQLQTRSLALKNHGI